MKCTKCGFDFGETMSNYCPQCGKKLINNRKEKLVLPNTDWLRLSSDNEASAFFHQINNMSVDDFNSWRQGMHSNVYIYALCFTYHRPGEISLTRHKPYTFTVKWLTEKDMKDEIDYVIHKLRGIPVSLLAQKYKMQRSLKSEECGQTWWRTKEECQAVVDRIVSEFALTNIVWR